MKRAVVTIAIAASAVAAVSADNWPQWRGPMLNGASSEKNLPTRWTPGDNIAWKLAVPSRSGATPIVWNNHIFLNVALQDAAGERPGAWTDRPGPCSGRSRLAAAITASASRTCPRRRR